MLQCVRGSHLEWVLGAALGSVSRDVSHVTWTQQDIWMRTRHTGVSCWNSLQNVCHLFPSQPYHAMGYTIWYRTTSRHIRPIPMGRQTSVFPTSSQLVTEYLTFLYKMHQFPDEFLAMTHLAIRSNARNLHLKPCSESRGSPFYYIACSYSLAIIHQWYHTDFEQKNYCRLKYFLMKVSSNLTYFIDSLQFQLISFQPKLFS